MSYIGASPTSAAFLTNSFSGDGTTTSFTLTVAPASSSSILVAVSGVLQDPATYAVVGTSLNFTGAPPSGTANIIVRFLGIPASNVATAAYRTVTEFTATAAQTTFSVPSYTPGFIDVYRNGVMLGSADYTATNGTTVVLASGATAGDLIEVISFYVSSIYNAISNTAGSVNANNIADGAVGTAEIADGAVTAVKIAAGAVGTSEIANANVTPAKLTTNGSGGFTLPTSAGNAVVADSSGRVTMPFQPAFFGAPNATVNATNKVTSYTNTRTRGGITFSSGVITVPVAGEYSVLINLITNGSAALTYSLRKNGNIVSYSAIDSGSFRTCALVEMVQMAANDYLEVWVDNGTMHSDAQYNAVSVFLIG